MSNIFKVILLIIPLVLFSKISNIKAVVETSAVVIKQKEFHGLVETVGDRKVNVFLGIPYAKPPIGELRFKKPVEYEFDKPIIAKTWPNPCSQIKLPIDFMRVIGNKNFSEDCLYLNIWSPQENVKNNKVSNGKQKTPKLSKGEVITGNNLKPVLFWIHGGGLEIGSSNWEATQGEILAAKGDVVVVTINYRLKYFGFFYTGSDDAPGNVGLWDQAMALKWVNQHIRGFGGDPNQITIIGESAGSWSVSLHLLSPISRNLFKNAIMMSGGALSDFYDSKENVKKLWSGIAENLGCKKSFDKGRADCLRNIDTEKFSVNQTFLVFDKPFVIYGDEFLPQKPSEMFKSGDYKKNVNLLLGTTSDEGSLILSVLVNSKKFSITEPSNITKSEAKQFLNLMLPKLIPKSMVNTEDVYKLYFSQIPEENFDLIRKSIGVAFGDYLLTCPTIEFGKLIYSGDRNRSKVYQYLWSAKYDNTWHGADHTSEVEYFFGSPFRGTNTDDVNKRNMSEKLIETISYFARNGNPPPQEGIDWNNYYMMGNKLIAPYYEFANKIKSEGNFGFDFKYECSKLWKKYIYNK